MEARNKMYGSAKRISAAALVAVLVLSGMVFVTNLADNGSANNVETIWGYVTDCADNTPVAGVSVTAEGLLYPGDIDPATTETFTTGASGYYEFTVEAHYYTVSGAHDLYYGYESPSFRFDATDPKGTFNFCLDKKPARDTWFNGTVVASSTTLKNNETLTFATTHAGNEDAGDNFTSYGPGMNFTNLDHWPVVNGAKVYFLGILKAEGINYTINLWTGNVTILTDDISDCLSQMPQCGTFIVNYSYAATTSKVQQAPLSTYIIYKNGAQWTGSDNFTVDTYTGEVTVLSNFTFGSDIMKVTYNYYSKKIGSAQLQIYQKVEGEVISTATADASGRFSIYLWQDTYEVRVDATDYETYVADHIITGDTSTVLVMQGRVQVWGWLHDLDDGTPIKTPCTAVLVNKNPALPLYERFAYAQVSNNYFEFVVEPGNYFLIVDANGYGAKVMDVTYVAGKYSYMPINLSASAEEKYSTEIAFVNNDWNNITVYWNVTLNDDSRIPGLDYDNIRNVSLQIDMALGNADGVLSLGEQTTFANWVNARGPDMVTTESFFRVNQYPFISLFKDSEPSDTDFSSSVQMAGGTVKINTVTKYTTNFSDFASGSVGAGIVPLDQDVYDISMTMDRDTSPAITSTDVYRNVSYMVRLPRASDGAWYERSSEKKTGQMNLTGFINVLVDPSEDKTVVSPTVTMVVQKSLNGTARAKVVEPADKIYVLNGSYDNYSAIVSTNTNITFSAADSTDPNGNLDGANYTWEFKSGVQGYGKEPVYNYTTNGTFTVHLTLTEAGGNVTQRAITIKADDMNPTAVIDANVTIDSGTWRTLSINQSIPVVFNGSNSSDYVWGSIKGEIREWRWYYINLETEVNSSALGETWEVVFENPGTYNLTLNVTDAVGHLSPTVNVTVFVKDTSPPTPSFKKLKNESWEVVEALMENGNYYFNATDTTDNYDSTYNLTYSWDFGDNATASGWNVSHVFASVGTYNVTLNVSDRAGNYKSSIQSTVVQPNLTARPDLRVDALSFKASPESPEQGSRVTISINVTNKENHSVANNVVVKFTAIKDDKPEEIQGTPIFRDPVSLAEVSSTIQPNTTVRVEIVWTPSAQGNFTIKINASVSDEHSGSTLDNTASGYINVVEAGWVRLAIYGAVIGIPILILVIIYLRRKYKRGELFRKKDEEEEEDKGKKGKPKKGKEEEAEEES